VEAGGAVVAIGEAARIACLSLAGAVVLAAENPEQVLRARDEVPSDCALVVLTPAADSVLSGAASEGAGLAGVAAGGRRPLRVVMP
jgi:hypothetical protein